MRFPIATICEPLHSVAPTTMRDRTLLFNEHSRRPFRIRSLSPSLVYGLQRYPCASSPIKSEFYTPCSAERPASRTKTRRCRLPSSFPHLYIPIHLACPIRLVRLFNESFFPSFGLGNRVKCGATNVCIHSVDTVVRSFDSPGTQRKSTRAIE